MLTDKEIRAATPSEKDFKMTDAKGLHLLVRPNGSKLWRYRFEFAGKERTLALGAYPDLSLARARDARDAARAQLRQGKDPVAEKAVQKARAVASSITTFASVAEDWMRVQERRWVPRHTANVRASLTRLVFPGLGRLPIDAIDAPIVLRVLRGIEEAVSPRQARVMNQRISAVFGYAMGTGLATVDPTARLTQALLPAGGVSQPAITDLAEARILLRKVEQMAAQPLTRMLHRFLALTATRPGEARGARWGEIVGRDGPEPLWRIPASRMKKRREHVVPLSPQAVEVLRLAATLSGDGDLVFPGSRHTKVPIHMSSLCTLLKRAGYGDRHVPHGWRSTFSSTMNTLFPADHYVIELMLAHQTQGAVAAAYNRAEHLARRRELAEAWANMLLEGALPSARLLERGEA